MKYDQVRREFPIIAILLLAAFLRLYKIDSRCLSGDGIQTLRIISASGPVAVANTVCNGFGADLPLYYIILHFWAALGKSVFWLRSLSALSGILTAFVGYRLVKILFGRSPALLTAFLLAFSPFRILFNQTVRYFSLNSLVNLVALYLFIRAFQNPDRNRRWVSYAFCRAISLYINYSSFLFLFSEAAYVFIVKKSHAASVRKWLVSLAVVIALWLPMSGIFLRDLGVLLSGEGFSRMPGAGGGMNILYFLYVFSVGNTFSPFIYARTLLIAVFLGFIVYKFIRQAAFGRLPREPVIFLLLMLIIPVTASALSNYPAPRYVMASGVMFAAILALGILALPRRAAVFALLFVIIVRGYSLFNLYAERSFMKMEFADDWDDIAAFVNANTSKGDIVFHNSIGFEYYFTRLDPSAKLFELPENAADISLIIDADQAGGELRRVVLVDSPLSGKMAREYRAPLDALTSWLAAHTYRLVDAQSFDRDPFALQKRRFITRAFPEYRTTVFIYERRR
jgi:hypothetical protein